MAFQSAANYNNLPNGVFSPTIFSKKAQLMFRKTSVAEDITNSEYFGEISSFGDSVRIIKEPEIVVRKLERGTQIETQDLEDQDFTLIVDRANYFAFGIDDIEKQQAHIDWMSMASNRAAYEMADNYDQDVLGYLSGYELSNGLWVARSAPVGTKADVDADNDELFGFHKLDATAFDTGASAGDAIVMGVDGTYDASPLQILNRMNRKLNELNVPREGRWVVVDPIFVEKLMDENSKLVQTDWNRGVGEGLQNGKLNTQTIRGFHIYESNNTVQVGGGAGSLATTANRSNTDFGVIIAGHKSAVATASQLNKVEEYRNPLGFGDIVRGMNLYGRKILRPEGLIRAIYNING